VAAVARAHSPKGRNALPWAEDWRPGQAGGGQHDLEEELLETVAWISSPQFLPMSLPC
jgi:hypothetical protein